MSQLVEHVRYRIGGRSRYIGRDRCDELVKLVIVHWPHRHLEAAMVEGGAAKAIDHALVLMRAQVREQWEARHGIGPGWSMLMAPTVLAIAHVLLGLWTADKQWRDRIEDMGMQLRTGGRA